MNQEPKKAYVFQPMAPQEDGRFYGVGGLHLFGVDMDSANINGVTKKDAEFIVMVCNDNPNKAKDFVLTVNQLIKEDWIPECGCRFESLFSSAVLLCKECSKQPAHNRRA